MGSADAFQAKFLAEQKTRVESLLTSRLELLASEAPPRLLEAMRYSLLGGGKRLRPILCLAFAAVISGSTGDGGMVGGQVLDIAEDRPADEGYLTRTHRLKTGALIRAACRMGVIASRGSAEALRTADTYGESVGLAFQITDDILDLVGDSSQMGKPTGADERAGRFTFPAVLGLPKSKALATECVNRALEALSRLDGSPGPLAALARFSIERRT